MRMAAPITVALAAVTFAGCGSNELSDKQLRTRASTVCRTTARQTNRIPTPSGPDGGAAFLRRGAVLLKPEVTRLGALRPPSDLAEVYRNSVRAMGDEVSELELTARRLRGGLDPVVAIKTLQEQLGPLESTADGGWRALDVPACLSG